MAYKTVRRNGRDVLINTATGKVVQPGQRIVNELSWLGKGINDNFTYSDKVDAKSGRRLTPAEVRRAEDPRTSSKPPRTSASVPATPLSKRDPEFRTKGGWTGDPNAGRPKPSATKPAVKPSVRPTTRTAAASSSSSSSRSSSSSSSPATRSVPSRSTSSQTSNAGTKNQDKNYRGNLFEKTFGYKKGEAPDQRDQRASAAVASGKASKAEYNVSNNEGNRRLNEKSSSQQLSDTAKKIKDAADKSRASRQMSAGEQRYMAYLERQRKGQGNVIG